MSKQTEALKLAREMLIENREYIQLYERPSYLALYDKAIARVEEALAHAPTEREQPAQHDYRIKYDRPCYKCRSNFCPGNCKEPEQPAQQIRWDSAAVDMTGAMATLPKTGSESVVDYKPVISDAGADANIPAIPGTYYGIVPKGTGEITVTNGVQRKPWVGLTEPVGEVFGYYERGFTDHKTLYGKLHNQDLPVGAKLYTSPPASKPLPEDYTALEQALTRLQKRYADLEGRASKPWVGLTDEEIEKLSVESGKATFLNDDEQTDILWFDGDCICLARAIEAKLREKNT